MKKTRKPLALILCALLCLSLLAGCGGNADTPSTNEGEEGDTPAAPSEDVNVSDYGENMNEDGSSTMGDLDQVDEDYVEDYVAVCTSEVYSSLYPWGSTAGIECNVEIYEKLYGWLRGQTPDQVYPILCDASRGEFGGYDHEAGTSDYTIYLYDYIVDQAGNPLTASDVKFCYDTNASQGSVGATWVGCDVVDPTTLVMHFTRELDGVGEFETILTNTAITTEKAYNDSPSGFVTDACGTGPYYLDNNADGTVITLKKNENYWQKDHPELMGILAQANVNTIDYVTLSEIAQRIIALEEGSINIAPSLGRKDAVDFLEGGEFAGQFAINTWAQTGAKVLYFNFASPLMSDVNLRMAVGYALDVDQITASLGEGEAIANHSLVPPVYPEYNKEWDNADNYNAKYDLDLAKEYLAKSSYKGEELEIITESTYSTVCEIIKLMLEQAGIKLKITTLDKATLTSVRDSGDWDLNIDQKAGALLTKNMTGNWSNSNTNKGTTYGNIDSPEWQAMLDEYQTLAGNTPENLQKWLDWAYENAVGMSLYSSNNYNIYSNWIVTNVMNAQNRVVPGAMSYVSHD